MKLLLVSVALFCLGCAGSYQTLKPGPIALTEEQIIQRYLDRNSWKGFSCRFKLKVESGDSAMSVKGVILYAPVEKIQLSFSKPYNHTLGDFYFTPTQTIYWGNGQSVTFNPSTDTVFVSELLPVSLPDWSPRDLLPFPIAARTTGLQTLSTEADSTGKTWLQGACGGALHTLNMNSARGTIDSEYVWRNGGDKALKTYERVYDFYGFPIPGRVIVENPARSIRLIWKLYDIKLAPPDAPLYN